MMLHQSSPIALECRMSALKGELMSFVHRTKVVPSDLATAVFKARVSGGTPLREFVPNMVAYLEHLK